MLHHRLSFCLHNINWSIENKFIEFLDLISGCMKSYWYYPSDLHEILSVLSQH